MLLFLWESHRAPMLTFMLLRFREPHGVIPWSTWCDSVKYMVWSCEPYGVILWNTWFDCVNPMVWFCETHGVIVWTTWCDSMKHMVWLCEPHGVITWSLRYLFTLTIAWETRSPHSAFTLLLLREEHGAHAFHSRSCYRMRNTEPMLCIHALTIAWETRSPCFPLTLSLHGHYTLLTTRSCYRVRNTEPMLPAHALAIAWKTRSPHSAF